MDGVLLTMTMSPSAIDVGADELPEMEFTPAIEVPVVGELKIPEKIVEFVKKTGRLPRSVVQLKQMYSSLKQRKVDFEHTLGELTKDEILFEKIIEILKQDEEGKELVAILNNLPEEEKVELVDQVVEIPDGEFIDMPVNDEVQELLAGLMAEYGH